MNNLGTTTTQVGGYFAGSGSGLTGLNFVSPGGRLTLTSNVPVTSSDVTAATTLYYTPYLHNGILLYDGTNWDWNTFSQTSISLNGIGFTTLTGNVTSGSANVSSVTTTTLFVGMPVTAVGGQIPANTYILSINSSSTLTLSQNATGTLTGATLTFDYTNYDVYGYLSSGSLALETDYWTNNSTRNTALATVNGRLVKGTDTTRLYLGTIRMTGNGYTEDSNARRYVWNMYNRSGRPLNAYESVTTWTYSNGSAWEQANANPANQVNWVDGTGATQVQLYVTAQATNSSGFTAYSGPGVDGTTATRYAAIGGGGVAGAGGVICCPYFGIPAGAGYHYGMWSILGATSGTTTWSGDGIFGITGSLLA